MDKVKILDCTLRDGGYVNDWNFGQANIKNFVNYVAKSGTDFIELGFLKELAYNPNRTFFRSINHALPLLSGSQNFTLMINFGEYDISNFSENQNKNIKLRVFFKKEERFSALMYCRKLIELGYDVFINPGYTNTYTKSELQNLIEQVNEISPYAFSVVDTIGAMVENDILEIFGFIDKILDSQINLSFHSHNSLNLSFSNAKVLIENCSERNLIIDSSVMGMGRGAGNLCTEDFAEYLNKFYGKNYDISYLQTPAQEIILPIYNRSPWGNSTPYYLCAKHNCHPNYAKFLTDKKDVSEKLMEVIFSQIPEIRKTVFDKTLINSLYESIKNKTPN